MAETFFDNTDARRFEWQVGGKVAALITYGRKGDMLALTHTETEPGFEGQGYAKKLVTTVVERAEQDGTKILPFCPYVASWLGKNPDHLGVVPEQYLGHFGLAPGAGD